ncbi:hypothetical protein [Bauldia litoralis]|uniref:hypothetical protein n=1 Tax=Bauldia litoralis TaxID=665467 RepID=UPI003265800F
MDRLRDILTAAAVGTAGVPSTAGIVSSLAGGFAGAQGYKRDAERQAAADAVKADDRAYERERQARADKLALEDRTYERGRDVKADKRADEKFALDTRKAVAEIKKIENADGSLTRSEVIQIERLVNDRAQKLGLNDTLLDADERNTRLQQLEAYRNDLEARVRGDAPEPVAPAGDVPVVNSPAEAARLPSGTVFRTPDGRTKVVP